MKFLIDNNTFQKDNDEGFIPSQRKTTHDELWNILCATGYQKLGEKENAEQHFNRVNLDILEIGWKKYYSLLYYFVQLNIEVSLHKTDIISTLKKLIDETYVSYYDDLLNNDLKVSVKTKLLMSS